MLITLPKYVMIKNNYCIGYFGKNKNKIINLKNARPLIEKELPNLKIYIACNDEMFNLLCEEERVIRLSELDTFKKNLAYFRELEEDEAVEDLLNESKIPFNPEIFHQSA